MKRHDSVPEQPYARCPGIVVLLIGLLLSPALAAGDLESELRQRLVAPEDIVRQADAIDLPPGHHTRLREIIGDSRAAITELELDLLAAQEQLIRAIERDLANQSSILEQFDRVLAIEHRIKRQHLTMWLEVNGLLEPDQQKQLLDQGD